MDSQQDQSPSNQSMSKPFAWVVIVVIVLILGVGGYLLLKSDNANTNTNQATNNNTTGDVNTNTASNTNLPNNTNGTNNLNLGITSVSNPYTTPAYQFQPPANLYIVHRSEVDSTTEFNKIPNNKLGDYSNTFLIIRNDNLRPAQVNGIDILLDEKPDSTISVGGHDTNVYKFPNGYEGTPPFIVYRITDGNVYYRLEFWNVSEATTQITSVLNSFQFIK